MKKIFTFIATMLLSITPIIALAADEAAVGSLAIDLTPIFQAIIGLLAALVTYRLIPWLRARTTAQQQSSLQALVNTLVYAAEQIYGAGHGDQKLIYVEDKLKAAGYDLDTQNIKDTIECNVKMLQIVSPKEQIN